MKELINSINAKFQTVIAELKSEKDSLEVKLANIKKSIDEKVQIASTYKENVEASNKTISDNELEIEKLKRDLQELHDKFESAGFKEIIEAGNKEINGKIIEYNTLIEEKQYNIRKLQEEASTLKDELVKLNESKASIESTLNSLNSAIGYYTAKINEMIDYADRNYDKLDEYESDDSDTQGLLSTDDIKNAESLIDSKIFDEIDEISTGKKELSDDELNTILSEPKEEEKEEVVEEQPTTTQTLDEVINQTQDILEKNKEEKIDLSLLGIEDDDDDVEPLVIEEEVHPNYQTAPQDSNLQDKIKGIGLDPGLFVNNSLANLKGNINVENGKRIVEVLDKHFIDINNLYIYPNILVTMNADALSQLLDRLELAGCLPTTIAHIFKYLDKIDIDKLNKKVQGQTDTIITILYECIPNLDSINISSVIGLSEEEAKTLEANLSPVEYNAMCSFSDIVKANYECLKRFNISELNKCFTEHPKRFMNNPDLFAAMLDKYDPDDLVRCINKNVAVIDKL